MTSFDVRRSAINIPITIHVGLTDGWAGARWDVYSVVDERTCVEIGDIGIYEFDAYSYFPGTLIEAVLRTFAEFGGFKPGVFYSFEVSVRDGGTEIGSASRYFRGPYVATQSS